MRAVVPKCFVISEIGAPDSPERRRADRFLDTIREALRRLQIATGHQIETERLDEVRTQAIFAEIVQRIVQCELVVAVLSNRNPNVHIELGIALAAGRNVEIMLEDRKEDCPSDLEGHYTIECDLASPESAIVTLVERFRKTLTDGENRLAFKRYDAMGKDRHGVHYLNRFKMVSFDDWSAMLWRARKQITVATTCLKHIGDPHEPKFYSRASLKRRTATGDSSHGGYDLSLIELLVLRAALDGILVRVMIMDNRNPFLDHLIYAPSEEMAQRKLQATNAEILATARRIGEYFRSTQKEIASNFLAERFPEYERFPINNDGKLDFVVLSQGPLYRRVTLTDQEAIVTPYHLVEPFNSELPCFWVHNQQVFDDRDEKWVSNNFYDCVAKDLDELDRLNTRSRHSLSAQVCRQILAA